jgi:hypothetical protein
MSKPRNFAALISPLFGLVVVTIGVLNLLLVHPVPGIAFLLLASLYFPFTTALIRQKLGVGIPAAVKIGLGLVIVWFTLGVSDLGDIIDDWLA